MFNGNAKIINASLTFLIKVPTQIARLNLYKKQISKTNFKSFPSAIIFSFCMYIKHVLCWLFCSTHIWLDVQPHDLHLKTLKCTRTFKALGHLRHSNTRALKAHEQMDTRGTLFSRLSPFFLAQCVYVGIKFWSHCKERKLHNQPNIDNCHYQLSICFTT